MFNIYEAIAEMTQRPNPIERFEKKISPSYTLDKPYFIIPQDEKIYDSFYSLDLWASGKLYLSGMFDLSNLFALSTDQRFTLYYFSSSKGSIKIGNFSGFCYDNTPLKKNTNNLYSLKTPSHCSKEYKRYLDTIQAWINGSEKPQNTSLTDYNEISSSYDPWCFTKDYSTAAIEIKQLYCSDYIRNLEDLAKLYPADEKEPPNEIPTGKANFLWSANAYKHPISENKQCISHGYSGNILLKKGDIVIEYGSTTEHIDLIDTDLDNVFCSRSSVVIRPNKNVSPYFLYFYLTSETGYYVQANKIASDKSWGYAYNPTIIGYHLPPLEELKEYPVIECNVSNAQFKTFFEAMFYNSSYDDVLKCTTTPTRDGTLASVLVSELKNKVKNQWHSRVKSIMISDCVEVKKCYDTQSYKSAIIMAGSILEAFIIDWLSELNGKDYFSLQKNEVGFDEKLYKYIEQVEKALKPDNWHKQKEAADHNRECRNYVHPKKLIQENRIINQYECDKVIKNLKDIIDSRYYVPFKLKKK